MARKQKLSRKVAVNLSLDPALRARADELAYSQNETLSSLVERLLALWVEQQKTKRK